MFLLKTENCSQTRHPSVHRIFPKTISDHEWKIMMSNQAIDRNSVSRKAKISRFFNIVSF